MVDEVVRAATAETPGVAILRAPGVERTEDARAALSARLSTRGIETLVVRKAFSPGHHGRRHVVLLADAESAQWDVIGWVRGLCDTSPRRHVVALCGNVTRLPRDTADWRARTVAVVARAERALASLELTEARAVLVSTVAEASLRGLEVPDAVARALAEAEMWASATTCVGACANPSPDVVGWWALRAWTRGDAAGVQRLARRLHGAAATTDVDAGDWLVLLRLLLPWSCARPVLRRDIRRILARCGGALAPASRAAIARAICARALIELHDERGARRALAMVPLHGPVGLLRATLEHRLAGSRPSQGPVPRDRSCASAVEALGDWRLRTPGSA
jgi:hypothetical protein